MNPLLVNAEKAYLPNVLLDVEVRRGRDFVHLITVCIFVWQLSGSLMEHSFVSEPCRNKGSTFCL